MKILEVKIPEKFEKESAEILEFLAGYDSYDKLHDGNFSSEWLLSDIHDVQWIIKTRTTVTTTKAEQDRTGKRYKYVSTVNWERLLPNGTYLTDSLNKSFLKKIQKLLFLVIEDPINQDRMAAKGISAISFGFLRFITWVHLHQIRFEPSKYGLSKVSNSDLEQFALESAEGGYFGVMRVGQKILDKIGIYLGEHRNPLQLESSEVVEVRSFLVSHGLYSRNRKGLEIVDRAKFLVFFGVSKQEMHPHSATLFLRQFEPELLAVNAKVLLPISGTTRYPTHRTPLINDIITKKYTSSSGENLLNFYRRALPYAELFEGFLPSPEIFRLSRSMSYIRRRAEPVKRTPWVSLKDNLLILNKSIDLIINDAEEIIDFYEKLMIKLHEKGHLERENTIDDRKVDVLFRHLPECLKKFNVVSFCLSDGEYRLDETEGISFVCLIEILIGACLTMIAGLKPIRVEELIALQYECLYFVEGDGYWLEQSLMKSGINDILPETAKPIPQITAKAIRFLRRINDIGKIWGHKTKKKESDHLLYRLNLGADNSRASIMNPDKIGMTLEKLCDFCGTSIDEYGRRWYINIHELRKSFLLTFFWTYKHASIDACQWIAGHKDPEHVHRYIESNISGEEMTELEAEYARQQVTYFHENSSLLEMQNTEELYQLICKHFNVEDYIAINKDELQEYIELCLAKGIYQIEAIGIGESTSLIEESIVSFKFAREGKKNE